MPDPGTIDLKIGSEMLAAIERAARRAGMTEAAWVQQALARALMEGEREPLEVGPEDEARGGREAPFPPARQVDD
ncbi:hypothetical protein [Roseococcus sp. YIM B11640]|uniref:hypothetical protein n=1 Tax=Roseococcus sp. YIM B11640 TaxID=3133973 RepID=UPI003C7E927E